MMFRRVLGIFDIFAIVLIILLNNEIIPWKTGLIAAFYLIIKGIAFKGDFASKADMIIGFYIIIMPIFAPNILTIIFIIYLGQKALVSFV